MRIKHAHLSRSKQGQIITEWIYNTPARVAAKKLHLNRNTLNYWYSRIREEILKQPEPFFEGIIEVDETYLGHKRPGVMGTGTMDRVPVFGMLERHSKQIWACVVTHADGNHLVPLITRHAKTGSTIMSDGHGAYYYLKDHGYKHYRVIHTLTYSLGKGIHSNGIESFWSYLRHHLNSRKGLPRSLYNAHVKEVVFRFNNRDNPFLRSTLKRFLNGK